MKKVNKIQESYLHLMTNNYEPCYEELLDLTNEISSHHRYSNSLMTELCRCLNELPPGQMNDVLAVLRNQYNTQH